VAFVCYAPETVRWFNAIALQHVGNRPATNFVTEIAQRALNAGIAPARIVLRRHAYDQLRDMTHHAGSARTASVGVGPFLGNQTLMPPQQGIRGDHGVEFEHGFCALPP
jgi:hypothetical protein